jgi:hypothetical protein
MMAARRPPVAPPGHARALHCRQSVVRQVHTVAAWLLCRTLEWRHADAHRSALLCSSISPAGRSSRPAPAQKQLVHAHRVCHANGTSARLLSCSQPMPVCSALPERCLSLDCPSQAGLQVAHNRARP